MDFFGQMQLDIAALRRRTRPSALKQAKVATAAAEQGRAFFCKLSRDFERGTQPVFIMTPAAWGGLRIAIDSHPGERARGRW